MTDQDPQDWHRKVARDLISPPAGQPARPAHASLEGHTTADGLASLEIGFGRARTAVAYVLELARAHRVPAAGGVAGDDIWIKLGDGRVRFAMNRRVGQVVVTRPGCEEMRVRWDRDERALVNGPVDAAPPAQPARPVELDAIARDAIDALVADWRASQARASSPVVPSLGDEEPTKG